MKKIPADTAATEIAKMTNNKGGENSVIRLPSLVWMTIRPTSNCL